jgi:rubredoxin-NAD+ reductase
MKPVVIVGSGLAGYTLAREFRALDRESPLVLLTADDGRYYSKPMLSNAFKTGKTPDTLAIASAAEMAVQLPADVRTHTRVTALDIAASVVTTGDDRIEYRALVLAMGADPIRLAIAGDGAADVLSINDLGDYSRFRARLDADVGQPSGRQVGRKPDSQRIVILGAGLIGCEFANDLRAAGYDVEVVDVAPHPLGRLLPPKAAASLRAGLEAIGVRFHFGASCEAVERDGGIYRVTLSTGHTVAADLVLSAVGLRPRTALAAAAGLQINRGIVTDRFLRTSRPNVYALGDCLEVEGLVLPFVMPIMHAARALAQTLAGTETPVTYPAMPVVVKTFSHPTVVSPPAAGADGAWEETVADGSVKALFRDAHGALLGFALTGRASAERQALMRLLPPVLA